MRVISSPEREALIEEETVEMTIKRSQMVQSPRVMVTMTV